MVRVRAVQPDDAEAIGRIHVRAWQRAYRGGLMPDEYLDGLSVDERATMWASTLRESSPASPVVLVAEDDTSRVQGFVALGPAEGDPTSPAGEVYALNVEPDRWGHGVGQALLASSVEKLTQDSYVAAVLWVHPDNERACRFYTEAGWVADGAARREQVLGVEVPEIRFRRSLTTTTT